MAGSDWDQMSGRQRARWTDYLWSRDRGVCCICGLRVERRDASCQHDPPLSKGGFTSDATTFLAHRTCNYALGNRSSSGPAGMVHNGLGLWL